MSNKIVALVWSCLITALAVIGIGASSASAQGAPKEITLGYSISLTGKFSTDATDTHRAYQLWAEAGEQGRRDSAQGPRETAGQARPLRRRQRHQHARSAITSG